MEVAFLNDHFAVHRCLQFESKSAWQTECNAAQLGFREERNFSDSKGLSSLSLFMTDPFEEYWKILWLNESLRNENIRFSASGMDSYECEGAWA